MKKYFFAAVILVFGLAGVGAAQTPNFTVDKNVFQPSTDIVVTTVFMAPYSGNASFILYNSAGEAVTNFGPAPAVANVPQTFLWYGKNGNGDLVSSGFYFFRFRIDLGTYIKKILVVR